MTPFKVKAFSADDTWRPGESFNKNKFEVESTKFLFLFNPCPSMETPTVCVDYYDNGWYTKFITDLLLIFTFKGMLSDEKDIRHQKRTAASLLPRALPLEKITIRIFEKFNERIFEYSNIRAELYFYPHIYFMVSSTYVLFPRFLYLILTTISSNQD